MLDCINTECIIHKGQVINFFHLESRCPCMPKTNLAFDRVLKPTIYDCRIKEKEASPIENYDPVSGGKVMMI
jgi:hypothetical protein